MFKKDFNSKSFKLIVRISTFKYCADISETNELEVHGICSLTNKLVTRRIHKETNKVTELDLMNEKWVPIEDGLAKAFQSIYFDLPTTQPKDNVIDVVSYKAWMKFLGYLTPK